MRGTRAVIKALEIFNNVKKQLSVAIDLCMEEIDERQDKVHEINIEIEQLKSASGQAKKSLEALNKIVGE